MFTLVDFLIFGIACAVITRLFWLDNVDVGYEGFWFHQDKFIQMIVNDDVWYQRLAWTDYVRQLFFNVYDTKNPSLWILKENRQGIVRCTFCLSFWVCLIPAMIFIIGYSLPIYLYPLIYLSFVGMSAIFSDRM